jgi:CRISPR/Cas system CSM-associated protein Csm4 (group 5 of RAMP superfamily)
MALIEVRLRPTTPWRVGHPAGDRERADVVYHSDSLYSAITQAMKTLGWLDEWLSATAQSDGPPAVSFSSLFPFAGGTRFITPPKTWWPPANPGRLYAEAAQLIPLDVVRNGITDESRWSVDGEIGCLVNAGSGAPLQIVIRTAAAVDRLTGVADPHRVACLEFAANAGWWGVFAVNDDDDIWEKRVKSAFRLLADSGFGGERSRGWGRAAAPEFSSASSLMRMHATDEGAWWLLSLYSPHDMDAVDWSRGEFTASRRGGWTDSQAGVAAKKQVQFVEEGSVLFAPSLRGRAVDVGPDGFPHPVYRAGFALAVPAPAEPVMRQAQTPKISVPPPEPAPPEALPIEAEVVVPELAVPEPAPPQPAAPEPPRVQEVDLPSEEVEEVLEAQGVMENEGGHREDSQPAPKAPPEIVAQSEIITEPDRVAETEAVVEAEAVMDNEGAPPENPELSPEEQS